jgi:anhydro-N-acetylmuramic acid kinase
MSGTSLDGVDLAYCEFYWDIKWHFNIKFAETIPYTDNWIDKLSSLMDSDAEGITAAHVRYGLYLGEIVNEFVSRNKLDPDFIASHGHTVFHQPQKGYTLQIGDGNTIAAITGLPVVFDFRSLDIALGGQGAPLVPIGDKLLFDNFDFCLNLGGISNISYELQNRRIAFDICPVNIILNYLARQKGLKFDMDGRLAAKGKINKQLLKNLNEQDYYNIDPPKSLGREWVSANTLHAINLEKDTTVNNLRTFAEHIAIQISIVINDLPQSNVLITGGGARNLFLIELLKSKVKSKIVIPDSLIIDFKEAAIFAFLGVLRWRNEINCLASVTGAKRDSSCGVIVMGR